jgi:GT2 family glycosyltransferase
MKNVFMSMTDVAVIVLNWNGKDSLKPCLNSLLEQNQKCTIFVIENGSTDGSLEFLKNNYPKVRLIVNQSNLGFAKGANCGIRQAMLEKFDYIALLNNDAIADKTWLRNLVKILDNNQEVGIATCKLLHIDNGYIDSTGECYTIWGLPYPRGRGEVVSTKYDQKTNIFAASGGASAYRLKMIQEIGLFDEDFFAYYEDVDISFRAQLAGWKVRYAPEALVHHQIGASSSRVKGFTTYQTIKNLPWLVIKDVPKGLLHTVWPRFLLAYAMFFGRAVLHGHAWSAFKGLAVSLQKIPKKLGERRVIQSKRTVSSSYISIMLTHDLPPNARNLRKLRSWWWNIRGKK